MENKPPNLQKKILLASQSPRRKHLLEQAGFEIEVRPIDVEETFPADMPAQDVAAYLAEVKAEAARSFLEEQTILLTADSIVVLDDKIYGKPQDRADALRILQELSGRTHLVITGVCLLSQKQKKVFSGITKVHFGSLTKSEIEYYVDRYQPYDKAGSYAIQEWIGLCKIDRIEGTYANVMGLPVELVYRELQDFSVR